MEPSTAARGAAVLIPAYKPDERFIELARDLLERGFTVWAVDDGSGEAYSGIFFDARELGVTVLAHQRNMGKGRAIKTGLAAMQELPQSFGGVVTADADGQHTPDDVERIAGAIADNPGSLVLGVRDFSGAVPLKSRMGNYITRAVYALITGIKCRDTQTGLRGLPRQAWDELIALEGERYEYEMNMLLKLRDLEYPLVQTPISTIYIDKNKSSHFSPLRDSVRIYAAVFRFCVSSTLSFIRRKRREPRA